MFRTVLVIAILLATSATAGYLAVHNVSVANHYYVPLMLVGGITRLLSETKIRLKQPLPPLPSWEETKAVMEHPPHPGRFAFFYVFLIFAFALLHHFLEKLSPLCGVGIEGVLAVGVAGGCVADVRDIGQRHLPAKYVCLLTACSVLIAVAVILMCAETVRSGMHPTPSGY